MKHVAFAVLLMVSTSTIAQHSQEEQRVKEAVETFFEGFHDRDSLLMGSVFHPDAIVQTIARNRQGETRLVTEELDKVIRSIVSIPDSLQFREVLHSFDIEIDGEMANVWTPYTFFMNGTISHCGVNNFQLLRQEEGWKVIYLIDTRRREGCKK